MNGASITLPGVWDVKEVNDCYNCPFSVNLNPDGPNFKPVCAARRDRNNNPMERIPAYCPLVKHGIVVCPVKLP